MQDSSGPALCLFISNSAIVIRRDTAKVLCVMVGDVGAATDTRGLVVGTNVPAHIVTLIKGTLHVVVADDLTLDVGDVRVTVLGTLVVTRL